jgi:hypothetical protein
MLSTGGTIELRAPPGCTICKLSRVRHGSLFSLDAKLRVPCGCTILKRARARHDSLIFLVV